jgi:hypothetical protein
VRLSSRFGKWLSFEKPGLVELLLKPILASTSFFIKRICNIYGLELRLTYIEN